MTASLFELFKIGIGPSSSHTVGPMLAARGFLSKLTDAGELDSITNLTVILYGSLALTGLGHGTDKAILLGLSGERPDELDPEAAGKLVDKIKESGEIKLLGQHPIAFHIDKDLKWDRQQRLPHHSNGMQFMAYGPGSALVHKEIYYSVGGGFVIDQAQAETGRTDTTDSGSGLPYPFQSARQLLEIGRSTGKPIAEIVLENETSLLPVNEVHAGIDKIWGTMQACIDRGCRSSGLLPGRLKVERRAGRLYQQLLEREKQKDADPMVAMDWVNLWAIAVNEENAAGGRVVTAPTNGAAGIIPAVLKYYVTFCPHSEVLAIDTFFLTAAAIGALYKRNASISGAEVGCQGEVGVACSMAAAGLTAALGGTNEQVETAAEIGMEHNLGLTCDPIGGLVQIPCIERNAMGAIKAINSSRIAMSGDGTHKVSLDRVIETMRQTGADMQEKYKETSRGGLAINVVEC